MEDDTSNMNRPQMYLFGCTLTSEKREFIVDLDDDETEQQLSLKAVCLGADAEDKFHMVEVEGLTYDGKATKVPLVALKPSVLPSMTLGGFEITPPLTFRLQSGSGPVHISGQHFVSVKDSDDEEEENNSSPVKRPAGLPLGKKPTQKKLKMYSEEDDDVDEEDSDDDDDDDESDVTPPKIVGKAPKRQGPDSSVKKPNKTPMKQNGPAGKPSGSANKAQIKTPAAGKDKPQAGSTKSLAQIRSKLSTAAQEGKPLPKTEQKFDNFVRNSFRITDKTVIKDLWSFMQTLKTKKM
ncbi:nucleophosmin 1b isoform X2 [Gouania willdenowi]|uniref:Nucleophosmin n=1 Tax=Gouania willdenowi TaxID=441366 RepID=A0A8C5GF59_GOUWI|nr:nucleophosmin-like isoform X2 [Gouania willdenowi]